MNVNNYKSIFQFMMVHPYLKDYLLQNSIVHIWVTYVYTYDIDCWYIRSLIQIPMLDILGRNVYSFSPYITSNCSQLLESPTQFAFRWPCYTTSQHTTLRHQFMEYHTFCGSIGLVLHDRTLQIRSYMQVVLGKGWLKIVVHNSLQPFIPSRSPRLK